MYLYIYMRLVPSKKYLLTVKVILVSTLICQIWTLIGNNIDVAV